MSFFNRRMPRLGAAANTLYRTLRLFSSNRSLRAWGSFLSYLGRRSLNQTIPPFITIAPTYRCVCRCVHCGVNSPGREALETELTTEQIKHVIDQAKKLGVLQVTFTGGEPLLREDLFEMIRHAYHLGLLTRINTSGLLLDREVVGKLKRAGLTQGAVSIDDADPETHDRLRGVPGAYDRAVQGIRNLKDAGIPCQINTVAARRNVPEGLKKIIELGRNLGVLAVYIILPMAIGRWAKDYGQVLTEEEKAAVRGLQETTFVHLELPTPKTLCGIL